MCMEFYADGYISLLDQDTQADGREFEVENFSIILSNQRKLCILMSCPIVFNISAKNWIGCQSTLCFDRSYR